jgi:hypothetical protein
MKSRLFAGCAFGLAAFVAGCGRDSRAAIHSGSEAEATPPGRSGCSHAACGNGFFVDVGSAASCRVGATCTFALTLVATGDYHINDEYPYKFRADDLPGVEFLGTDGAGKNVFSKVAKNWSKRDERTGTMTVTFQSTEKGTKPIVGIFKLSVCSAQNCQLEQQQVTTMVDVS